MSQAELSRRLGITRNAMNLIEMGRSDPRASRVKEIASILRVSTDYLLGMEEEYSTDAQRSAV
jgi:transcriptional regulator with XRE-family HTH domain